MCGIAGVIFPTGAEPGQARAIALRMRDALVHRGPDDAGVWTRAGDTGPAVAFAHTRLAILDVSSAGHQPMTDAGQTAITYNGETYNFRDLRSELQAAGDVFRTQTDTEVVLRAYARWGNDAVSRLNGMFAFGIWDESKQRLLLARDRLGIKPLYYSVQNQAIVFASEVRALLASGLVRPRLDSASLWQYLGYQTTSTPETLLEDVFLLEPGHSLVINADGSLEKRCYWDLLSSAEASSDDVTIAEARGRVGELLHDAAASHLVSDVPVGVFLSGGIDSSALVALLHAQGVTARTFNVSFAEATFDESAEARRVADAFGADHTEVRLTEGGLLDMLPDMLAAVDHPSGDGVNTYVVSEAVRRHGVKVALSGLGGDELFGGYPSFERLPRLLPASERWGRSPQMVRAAAAGVVRAVGGGSVAASKAAAVLESDGRLAHVWPITRQVFSPEERRALLPRTQWPQSSDAGGYAALLEAAYEREPDRGLWSRVSYAEARTYMHDVLLRDTDQMSMAHALEVRVPLLDHRLAAYVMGLPDHVKQAGGTPKSLLVESLSAPLPRGAAERPKQGFTLPFDRWMRDALRPLCEAQLGANGLEGRALFRPGEVSRLWRAFLNGAPGITWARMWTLVALNSWLDRHGIAGPAS
jgi:asparagine synthase (glutamine-hydrolysing)